MGSFEIVVGQRQELLASPTGAPRMPAKVDPIRHRDVIDIFVDGANVSARAPADRVYPVIRELVGAVYDLTSGTRDKVVVPFHEAPYELVLERKGSHALVTFYRGGSAPEVAVKDRPVPLEDLRRAACEAAESLCERLWSNSADDPRCLELLALSERARGGRVADGLPRSRQTGKPRLRRVRSRWFSEVPPRARLAFGFEAELPAHRGLGTGGVRADLHALLFRGRLCVHNQGTRTLLSESYLFLRTERLLQACRHLSEAAEAGRSMSVRLESDGLLVGVKLDGAEAATLSVSEPSMPSPICFRAEGAVEIVEAVASVGRELRAALSSVGEGRNLRVRELGRAARQIRTQVRSLRGEAAVECCDADSYRASAAPRSEASTEGTLGSARRLGFTQRWRLEAEGLDLGSSFLCGDRLIVTAKKSLCAIDREHGEVLWKRDVSRATSLVAGDGILRLRQDGRATMHELYDGEPRWSVELKPRVGGSPIAVAPAGVDTPPIAVVAEGKRTLTGIDLRTGERRWQFAARRGGAFRIRRTGRLLHVTCGDSAVYAVDLLTGELAWRYTNRDRFKDRPVLAQEALLATSVSPDGTSCRLHAMDAFSGRPLWCTGTLAVGSDAPVPVGSKVVLAVPGELGLTFLAFSAATGAPAWKRSILEAGSGYQALAVDDALVINVASGKVFALAADTGEPIWCTDLGRVRDVPRRLEPVLRGGALFVPSQTVCVLRPGDGEVLHRFAPATPIPDYLRVDERFALYVGEDSGLLICYGLGARLMLVQS